MRKYKYHFVLEDYFGNKISSDAHTLMGVKSIFKRMNVVRCHVYKRHLHGTCPSQAFVIFQK